MPPKTSLKPRKRPVQARSKATVDAILRGAAQVLQKSGYAGATTDRIAARAGVSVGSLYQYFPNKDAVLVALAQRHIDEGFRLVGRLLVRAVGQDPPLEELLRSFVAAMVALHEHQPALHRVLFEEVPLPASVRRGLRERENAFADELAALLDAHAEVHVETAAVTSYVVVHTVDALVHNFILHPPNDIDGDALVDEVVRMLFRHLSEPMKLTVSRR